MAALNRLPERSALRGTLMLREGLGWRVGVGPIVGGAIEGEASTHLNERDAERAAIALGDRRDLIVVRG